MMSKVSDFNFCYQIDEKDAYTAGSQCAWKSWLRMMTHTFWNNIECLVLNLSEIHYGCWRVDKSSDHTISENCWDYQDLAIAVKVEK